MLNVLKEIQRDLFGLDRRLVFALCYAAVGLSCIYYFKDQAGLAEFLSGTSLAAFGEWVARSPESNLPALGWWVAVVTVFYFVIPASVIKFVWKAKLRDFGLAFSIESGFWRLFAICATLLLPLVYLMSLTEGFAAKYPFLQIYGGEPYLGTTFFVWELIYFIQFFGLEFFFRGFLVHSLKPSLGLYSIFVMTVPYCMIHFGKPFPETIAAVFAGIFLGWLSYRNGNIWMGLLLHCTVAFSMDAMALYNKGLLF